jgi:geranylgeranyl diphosphate synthase type I
MKENPAKEYLAEYLKKTDPLFIDYLNKKVKEARAIGKLPANLLSRFSKIARKGKKVRGFLVVLGYELAGGKDKKAIYDVSIFIELLHAGLLAHDDIQDQDEIRRGIPTIHTQYEKIGKQLGLGKLSKHYGESMGMNVGISAYFLAFDKLLSSNFPPEMIVKAGRMCADYITRTAHGQSLDVSNIFIKNTKEKELLNILKHKTAMYTGAFPLLAGASLAGLDDKKKLKAIENYGLNLGWAFQIQDDILGTFGDEKKLGKSVGIDIAEGKVTLLALHLIKHGAGKHKKFLKSLMGKKRITQSEVEEIKKVYTEVGSYDYVVDLGWKYVKEGKKQIPLITKDKKLSNILDSFISYMMERAF